MGRSDFFRLGDYNAICDTCGGKFKASVMRLTWDGWFVCKDCWEPRHPQDLVRSKHDMQRVPIARPDDANQYNTTTIGAGAVAGATTINVGSIQYMTQYTVIQIELDNSQYFVTRLTATPIIASAVFIEDPLPFTISIGNTVYIFNHDYFLTYGEVTTDDL